MNTDTVQLSDLDVPIVKMVLSAASLVVRREKLFVIETAITGIPPITLI